ncbi:MAG: NAD(P)H-dependent oxidoreductase [Planctomycetota bacterium]|nr:NAD(P)H-dependent oxidoreductase [Planctomycetota bacterium]
MATENGIRIAVITGSVRPGNYTGKAAALVMDELSKLDDVTAQFIDPASLDLPAPGAGPISESMKKLKDDVAGATGVILATPEYHGSFSSVMKLVIENLGYPSVLSGKPVALLGVAAGAIGAVKSLEHLRSVCSHIGAIVLPGPVSVANVQGIFGEDGRCLDDKIEGRIRGVVGNLRDYIIRSVCPKYALERFVREGASAD